MFRKKRKRPWFILALFNLVAAGVIYRLARGFQKQAQKMGADKKRR